MELLFSLKTSFSILENDSVCGVKENGIHAYLGFKPAWLLDLVDMMDLVQLQSVLNEEFDLEVLA